jgi:uncharacterized protein
MDISFDPAKSKLNAQKHGIGLERAADIEWDNALMWHDARQDYAEKRHCAIGYIGLRLFYVCFTDRDNTRRIISLRKANQREVNRYANA